MAVELPLVQEPSLPPRSDTKPIPASKSTLRIAGAQIPVTENASANLATISRAIDFAISNKADILLTPEGSLSGYYSEFDATVVSQALEAVVQKARLGGLALALGTCFQETDDNQRYNQIRFYSGDGTFLGFHSKILLCRKVNDPSPRSELDSFKTAPLRTFQLRGLTIGGLICNDYWANPEWTPMADPHLTQQLAILGAKIIFLAVNGGPRKAGEDDLSRPYHEANLLLRARAARAWVVVADNCGVDKELYCSTPCGVIDPTGKWVLRTPPNGEHFFVYTIETTP